MLRAPKVSFACAAALMLAAIAPRMSIAQRITIDGRLSSAQTLIGPSYSITANLGKQVGGSGVDQVWYRWMQAMTQFSGNGQGTNVPSTSVLAFMGLRRS